MSSTASTAYAPDSAWMSLMPVTSYSQCVSQPDHSVSDPGLGRADREVEHRGHFGVRVTAVVGEGDGLALRGRQPLEGGPHPPRLERRLRRVGGGVVVDRDGGVVVAGIAPAGRLCRADPVDTLAVGDG